MNFEKSQFRTIPNLKCSGSAVFQVYYGTEVKAVNKSGLCVALGSDINLFFNVQLYSAPIKTV